MENKNKNKNMNLIYKVTENISINDILEKRFCFSTRLKNRLISKHLLLLNNQFVDTRTIVKPGDLITICLDYPEQNSNIVSKKMDLKILFEDDYLLIVNKPSGIPVHPSILHYSDSLASGIKWYFDNIGLSKKIRAVNRIDLNTSGIVVFAKNEYVQEMLIKQMQNNLFKKSYLAFVEGKLPQSNGTIDLPIARKNNSIIERCVSSSGQSSITKYRVIKEFENYSFIECSLVTGRTHQIRVHMSYLGHPLLGDTLYNKNKTLLINRQALHSFRVSFKHPITNEDISIVAPLPDDLLYLLKSN